VGRQLQGSHLGEGDLSGFGAGVGREAGVAKDARAVDRGDDDDGAARPLQVGQRVLDGQECTSDVDGEGLVPFVRSDFFQGRPYAVDAGIGNYNVDAAPGFDDLPDGVLHLGRLGDVGDQGYSFAARLPNGGGDLVHLASGAAEAGCLRPLLGKGERSAFADAGTGAGNKGDTS